MATAKKEREQSVRLTDDMRGAIVKALVANATDKRWVQHAASCHKLALRLYNVRYSTADRKKMLALPKGWLCEATSIVVNLSGEKHGFAFGPYSEKNQASYRVPHKDTDRYGQRDAMVLEPRSELGLAVRAYVEAGEKLSVERDELRAKARGIIASVTTTAKLAEVWPEIKPFLPKFEPRLLPVVRREELNAAFGLKQAAA